MTHLRRPWTQRCLAAVALLAYLAGTVGLPLPAPAPRGEADADDAEPVAGLHRCGCPVEEQRQGTCCCCQGGGCCANRAAESDETPPESVHWVGGGWTARCQGDPPAWLVVALPLVVVTALPPASPLHADRAPPADDEFADRLSLPLPEPPPRSFSA